MKVIAALFLTLLLGCSHGESHLRARVDIYCSDVRNDIDHAIPPYARFAADLRAAGSAAPAQGTIDLLAVDSIGMGAEIRHARVHDFVTRFEFCLHVHSLDDKRADDLEIKAEKLRDQLDTRDALDSPDKTVGLLQQLSALVHELDGVPYLD